LLVMSKQLVAPACGFGANYACTLFDVTQGVVGSRNPKPAAANRARAGSNCCTLEPYRVHLPGHREARRRL
jgi:hypothetical protein